MFDFSKLPLSALFICGILAFASGTHAQSPDIQTTYSTQKGACGQGPDQTVVISKGSVSGPGFECRISNPVPAGTGLEAYSGVCNVDGAELTDTVGFDLGNNPDHFSLAVPGRDGWLDIYPCTKVPGLE